MQKRQYETQLKDKNTDTHEVRTSGQSNLANAALNQTGKRVSRLIPGGPKKASRTLRNYNGAYTLWGEISFGTFVDLYVLLLTDKFQ